MGLRILYNRLKAAGYNPVYNSLGVLYHNTSIILVSKEHSTYIVSTYLKETIIKKEFYNLSSVLLYLGLSKWA